MPTPLETAIQKGIEWLVSKQNINGSWGATYPVSTSSLILLKLESYAREQGLSPFDDKYIYKNNVISGLNFIFENTKVDVNGLYYQDGTYINYTTGVALSAICANTEPDRVISASNPAVNGLTYKQVAQKVVDYLVFTQQDIGERKGGWSYSKGFVPDNSNSGYVTLGLEFALDPIYNFSCSIPDSTISNLNDWIDFIQNTDGGSGYQLPNQWVNILKTGNLILEMNICGDPLSSDRLKKATTYIADNWTASVCLVDCAGWNSNPADYQATFTTMKGLTSYGIDIITTSTDVDIDWFADMSTVIINQQLPDGSWPRSQWDQEQNALLSAVWALLTLEKVVLPPSEPKIPYIDNITAISSEISFPMDLSKTVEVQGEIKLFAYKYTQNESENIPGTKPSKGDDVAFALLFGNYGEFPYAAPAGKPTVEDTLNVQSPANLKLMSLSLNDNLRLFNVTDNKLVSLGDMFLGGIIYKLQVQKLISGTADQYEADFDLPANSIYSVAMLLQVEF